MPKNRVCWWVQRLYKVLVQDGLVAAEDLDHYKGKSLRAGATSAGAAAGVRKRVAAGHLRMRSVRTLDSYDKLLEQDRGAMSRALNSLVAGAASRRKSDT